MPNRSDVNETDDICLRVTSWRSASTPSEAFDGNGAGVEAGAESRLVPNRFWIRSTRRLRMLIISGALNPKEGSSNRHRRQCLPFRVAFVTAPGTAERAAAAGGTYRDNPSQKSTKPGYPRGRSSTTPNRAPRITLIVMKFLFVTSTFLSICMDKALTIRRRLPRWLRGNLPRASRQRASSSVDARLAPAL